MGVLIRLLPLEILALLVPVAWLLVGFLAGLVHVELLLATVVYHHLVLLLLVLLETARVAIHGHAFVEHLVVGDVVDQDLFHVDVHAHFLDLLLVRINRPRELLEQGRVLDVLHLLELIPQPDLILLDGLLHVLELLVVLLSVHHLHVGVVQVVLVRLLLKVPRPRDLILPGRADLGAALKGFCLRRLLVHGELLQCQLLLCLAGLVDLGELKLFVAGVPVDWGAATRARLLLDGLPLLCRHHLVGLNLLRVLH